MVSTMKFHEFLKTLRFARCAMSNFTCVRLSMSKSNVNLKYLYASNKLHPVLIQNKLIFKIDTLEKTNQNGRGMLIFDHYVLVFVVLLLNVV